MPRKISGPPSPLRPPARADSVTYFIQGEDGGPIKIGRSNRNGVEQRLAHLQIGSAVKLRITCVLDGDQEAKLHYRFRDLHIAGEWFYPHPRLASVAEAKAEDVDLEAPAIREAFKRGFRQGWTEASKHLADEAADYVADVVRTQLMKLAWEWGVTERAEKAAEGAQSDRTFVSETAGYQPISRSR